MRVLILLLSAAVVWGKVRSKGFGGGRGCDACLVLAEELVGLCGRVRPQGMYAEVWAEDVKEKGVERAVVQWMWSQPKAEEDFGIYKPAAEILKKYANSPAERHRIEQTTASSAKRKDTKRFNLLLEVLADREDHTDPILLKCGQPNHTVTFNSFSKVLCAAICEDSRLHEDTYPGQKMLDLIQKAINEKEGSKEL